jgi:hypothetical protein
MWLPKDERKLLIYYYRELEQPNLRGTFYLSDLINQLKCSGLHRVRIANTSLDKRGMIILMPPRGDGVDLELTLTGYDLGRKYNSWLIRTGLWFAEYKDHWFWLILSFLGGIIGALIVNWLSNGC